MGDILCKKYGCATYAHVTVLGENSRNFGRTRPGCAQLRQTTNARKLSLVPNTHKLSDLTLSVSDLHFSVII